MAYDSEPIRRKFLTALPSGLYLVLRQFFQRIPVVVWNNRVRVRGRGYRLLTMDADFHGAVFSKLDILQI